MPCTCCPLSWQDSLALWAGMTDEQRGSPEWQAAVTAAVRGEEDRQVAARADSAAGGDDDGGDAAAAAVFGVDYGTVRLGKVAAAVCDPSGR
jgi:hypothetical protein